MASYTSQWIIGVTSSTFGCNEISRNKRVRHVRQMLNGVMHIKSDAKIRIRIKWDFQVQRMVGIRHSDVRWQTPTTNDTHLPLLPHARGTRSNLFEIIEMKPRTTRIINIRRTNNAQLPCWTRSCSRYMHIWLDGISLQPQPTAHAEFYDWQSIRINLVSVKWSVNAVIQLQQWMTHVCSELLHDYSWCSIQTVWIWIHFSRHRNSRNCHCRYPFNWTRTVDDGMMPHRWRTGA